MTVRHRSSSNKRIPQAWPRGMSLEVVAAYTGLSETSIKSEVKAGRAPSPTWMTRGRMVWLKEKIDDWIDEKDGRTASIGTEEDWDDAFGNEDRTGLPI